ncbi:hypothetical protein HYPP_02650 [Hyphomicrobium sp. ghe19]|uniref:DUF6525 family protein n=1 Tax=Hyphomicrobium sp. ghe19 TaxID=2682968 RepID=UPI001367460C|nr:hypothetical protein HYPP_02650 [Hyphomicrobium sp. ghe19]
MKRSHTGNASDGASLVSRSEALSAFDALPKGVRRLLHRASGNWNSVQLLKLYRKEGAVVVVERIRRLEAHRRQKYYEAAETGFRDFKG